MNEIFRNIFSKLPEIKITDQKLIDKFMEAFARALTLIRNLEQLTISNEKIDEEEQGLVSFQSLIEPSNMIANLGIAQIDAPIVGSGMSITAPRMGPLLSTLLSKLGANVRSVDLDSKWANKDKLETEVHLGIEAIRHGALLFEQSVLKTLLKYAPSDSELGKIRDMAKMTMATLEAIALPGGGNIEPEFYSTAPLQQNHDYRRTLTECALIFAADEAQKSVSATCRGQQLLNVYFGGTLETVRDYQYGWHKIELSESPHKDKLIETLQHKNFFPAYSNHGQACEEIANNLYVVASYANIPKCIMNQSGSLMGFQFHPELSENGKHSPAIQFYELWFKGILDRRSLDLFRNSSSVNF